MVWSQIDVDKPHLVYILLGAFTTVFMLCSSIIKERMYIGEATVATLFGLIFGPHCANLIDPGTWGNTDQITLEFSRIVLVVQCFAVGVELPKAYMEKHWRSVTFLLVPVMTFGWLITSVFIYGLIVPLNWLDSLVCAACVTATDPVLASSVVGKGKFAKRVPKHLRDLLSAESGCNDGMAFPFIYLALYLVRYRPDANAVAYHWFCYTILYECIFGCIYGVLIGYIARRAIRYAHEHDLIDRESFLVFYFVLALFCAGSGSILGIDDLLVGFSCGVGFSNDGWFTEKTEETHVSNVIDLLLNLAFFVYFGTIIPWEQFNSAVIGTSAWRLAVIAILVILFRRIPIMLALTPVVPDIKTWRESLFAGHFGPIGVGAIYVAILARAELEHDGPIPLAEIPTVGEEGYEHINVIRLIWPITTFLVLASIIIHGSSIAVFTLGKHINTLTITMSYTQANEDGYSWMDRLPRIQSRSKSSMSLKHPAMAEDEENGLPFAPAVLANRNFLRQQKEDENPSKASSRSNSRTNSFMLPRTRSTMRAGGPVTDSAIGPPRRTDSAKDPEKFEHSNLNVQDDYTGESPGLEKKQSPEEPRKAAMEEAYQEGDNTVIEDEDGNVLEVLNSQDQTTDESRERIGREMRRLLTTEHIEHRSSHAEQPSPPIKGEPPAKTPNEIAKDEVKRARGFMQRLGSTMHIPKRHQLAEGETPKSPNQAPVRRNAPARAFRFGRTIIVEDEDGEVIKKYDIPAPERAPLQRQQSYLDADRAKMRLQRMGNWLGVGLNEQTEAGPSEAVRGNEDVDDKLIRFTVNGEGRRMSKAEFIQEIQKMDPKLRTQVVEDSNVREEVKKEARADLEEHEEHKEHKRQQTPQQEPSEIPNLPPTRDSGESASGKAKSPGRDPQASEVATPADLAPNQIPLHSVSEDLVRHSRGRPQTAAERRRNELPVLARKSSDESNKSTKGASQGLDNVEETAAERRRREAALGKSKEDSDSDEDESAPRQPPGGAVSIRGGTIRQQNIRFADIPSPSGSLGAKRRWR